MKLKSKLLGLAAIAAMTMGFASFSTPAQATVQTCTQWPTVPLTSYPRDGHLFQCFPSPRNSNEQALQSQMMNSVSSAVAQLSPDELTKLKNANVQIKVFYNGTDATQTLGENSSFPPKPTETGRSWVIPNANTANLSIATSSVWMFTLNQFNALNGAIPTTFNSVQSGGTAHHELGHQMDRIWATQNALAPTASALVTGNTTPGFGQAFISALNFDGARLTSTDIQTLTNQFPSYLDLTQNPPLLRRNEFIAELFAVNVGGGATGQTGPLDTFIARSGKFPCAAWVVAQMHTNNGTMPAVPDTRTPGSCYGKTSW